MLHDAVDVRRGLVGLGDGDHDLHAALARDLDALLGLRHDTVVGGDDENGDIGKLCAAGAHGAERGVAGSIEERNLLSGDFDLVGAYLLRNAAGLAGGDVFLADVVHQGGLAVVDVAEECDDRRARLERLGGIVGDEVVGVDSLEDGLGGGLVARLFHGHGEAILLCDLDGILGFDALVDGREDLEGHQVCDEAVGLDAEFGGKVLHYHRAAD